MDNSDCGNKPDRADSDPRPAAVTLVSTEHFTLQGAPSATISESIGRASVFLGAVYGGLIATQIPSSSSADMTHSSVEREPTSNPRSP